MKTVLSFKYNGKVFYLLEYKNKYRVAWKNKDKLNFSLNEEEKEVLNQVLYSITPDRNYIEVTPLYIKDSVYPIYYNKSKDLFFSNTLDTNVIEFINKFLNNRNEFLASNVGSNKFKRVVKVGKKVIVVYLLASTTLLGCANIKSDLVEQFSNSTTYEIDIKNLDLEEDITEDQIQQTSSGGMKAVEDFTEDESLTKITDAINSNANLTEEEKQVLLSNTSIFSDNYEYLQIYYVTNILSNLKIEYVNDANYAYGGQYYPSSNKIVIYNASSIDDIKDTYLRYLFTHEFCHSLTVLTDEYNRFLTETTNSIFNDEYYGDDTNYDLGYLELKQITKALIEIIGTDAFREYQFNGDSKYIKNALMEIIGSEIKADSLLANMEQYYNYFVSLANGNLTEEEEKTIQDNKEKVKTAVVDYLEEYYSVKYNMDARDDLVMLRYLDYNQFRETLKKMYNLTDDDTILIDSDKYYFNSEKLNDTIIVSINNSEYIEINNENRYINNELER